MKIISSKGNLMVLEHTRKNGKKNVLLEISVDPISKKFIKENLGSITLDTATGYLRLINAAPVSRAIYQENWEIPEHKNVLLADGDKFNLKTKNLVVVE